MIEKLTLAPKTYLTLVLRAQPENALQLGEFLQAEGLGQVTCPGYCDRISGFLIICGTRRIFWCVGYEVLTDRGLYHVSRDK